MDEHRINKVKVRIVRQSQVYTVKCVLLFNNVNITGKCVFVAVFRGYAYFVYQPAIVCELPC